VHGAFSRTERKTTATAVVVCVGTRVFCPATAAAVATAAAMPI